jgi:hypothetical protein
MPRERALDLREVLFVTRHLVSSNNNPGRSPDRDVEHAERHAVTLAWMSRAMVEERPNVSY